MMGFMTKSPATASSPVPTGGRSEPAVSVSLSGEDPFCGMQINPNVLKQKKRFQSLKFTDLGISRLTDENLSSSPLGSSNKFRPDNLPLTPFGSVIETEVETAMEADEALTFDAGDDACANLTPEHLDQVNVFKL